MTPGSSPFSAGRQDLPEDRPSSGRSVWNFRRRRPAARRKVRLRWSRLAVAAAGVGLLAGLFVALPRSARSPFQGLLPAGTPLALEGDTGAVLDFLSHHAPLGPRVLQEFGLTGALAGGVDRRALVAVLPGAPVGQAEPCRRGMEALAVTLDEAWESGEAYPAVTSGRCPSGRPLTYAVEGADYRLECPEHHLRYDSTSGFTHATGSSEGSPVLVALEEGARPRPPRPLSSRDARGVQVLCTSQPALDRALEPEQPTMELPGPPDAPVRLVASGPQAAEALPPVLQAAVASAPKVRIWGDPARGRWSLRVPHPAEAEGPAVDVAGALGELPAAPVALAAEPRFLARLSPAAAEALGAGHPARPEVVALAAASPLRAGSWSSDLARLLAGRSPAVLAASCADEARARRWLAATRLGSDLRAGPGLHVEVQDGAVRVEMAAEGWAATPRPKIPAGEGEALAAGWLTLAEPNGTSALYAWSAGLSEGDLWLEVARSAAEGPAAPSAAAPPTIKSR